MPDNTHLPPPLTHRPPLPQHPAHTAISPPHGAPCHPTAGASRHPSQIYPGNGTHSSTCNRPPAPIPADAVYPTCPPSAPSRFHSSSNAAIRRAYATLSSPTPAAIPLSPSSSRWAAAAGRTAPAPCVLRPTLARAPSLTSTTTRDPCSRL